MTLYYRLNISRTEEGIYYLRFEHYEREKIFRSYENVIDYLKNVNAEKFERKPIFTGFDKRQDIKAKLEVVIERLGNRRDSILLY